MAKDQTRTTAKAPPEKPEKDVVVSAGIREVNGVVDHGDVEYVSPDVQAARKGSKIEYHLDVPED